MRKALVLGVAVLSLIAFSGLAAGGTLYGWSYTYYNTQGWLDLGYSGGYHLMGKYNYRAYEAYGEDYGWLYLMDQDVHSQFSIKCLDGNKPITITHYNGLVKYHAEVVDTAGTYIVSKDICRGHLRLIDPKASDMGHMGGPDQAWYWFPGLVWCITKITAPAADSTTIMDMVFKNIDATSIPMLQYMVFEIGNNVYELDFNWS